MENKLRWRIAEKHRETPDTATLVLVPEPDGLVAYQPGQYLPLIRAFTGKEARRAYSFSTCMGVDALPAITVKRVPNGLFSNWLVQDAAPGDVLVSGELTGRFVLPEQRPKRLVYVAAGSGITPVMSHLKWLLSDGNWPDVPIALFYANRDAAHTIFKKQVDAWIEQHPERFSCTYFFSQEKDLPHAVHGHLNNDLFERLLLGWFGGKSTARDRAGTHIYLCAPKALMRMARMTLRVLDFPEQNIHQETFLPDPRLQQRTLDISQTHRITATGRDGERVVFEVYAGETILNGALRQGIALPYTCKSGVCFTCLARCVRGAVEVSFVEQTKREGPGGLVNTCIGYAVTAEVELQY